MPSSRTGRALSARCWECKRPRELVGKPLPVLLLLVCHRFEEALQEARQVDQLLAEGRTDDSLEKYPFLGVPFTVKEAFSLHGGFASAPFAASSWLWRGAQQGSDPILFAGMPNTSGLVKRRCVIAATDAVVVGRMKQAGAIPLGVTNCSELCMWFESSNKVYGCTNNPYDLQHIAGGSSGASKIPLLCFSAIANMWVRGECLPWGAVLCKPLSLLCFLPCRWGGQRSCSRLLRDRSGLRHWRQHPDAGVLQWCLWPQTYDR